MQWGMQYTVGMHYAVGVKKVNPTQWGMEHTVGMQYAVGVTGRKRLIRNHSSARFCFELSGNSN